MSLTEISGMFEVISLQIFLTEDVFLKHFSDFLGIFFSFSFLVIAEILTGWPTREDCMSIFETLFRFFGGIFGRT